MSNNSKRRGFSPVLAFILGILFGIILLIGTLVAAVFIALNYKLDNISKNKNEDGTYIYINADPENGGVATVLDLVKKVAELAGDYTALSLGEVENLLPVTEGLTQKVYDALNKFVEIDTEEVKQVKFGALGEYFKEKAMDIRPAALLESFGGGLADNELISLFLNGKEADYVEDGEADYPVYYDIYQTAEEGFSRVGDGAVLDAEKEQYLVEKGEQFRLYFYNYGAARSAESTFITYKQDGKFVFAPEAELEYSFNQDTAKLSGNYYYDGETKVEITPVTIGSFTDGSAFDALDEVSVTDLVGSDDELTQKLLGDIYLGELISGDVDFEKIVDGIEVSTFMDVKPTDAIMAFLAFGITEIRGEEDNYTAVYHPVEGEPQPCVLVVENGNIKNVTLAENGEEVHKTGIKDVPDQVSRLTKTLKLKDIITIDESDRVMTKLGEYTVDSVGNAVDELTLDDFMEVELTRKDGKLHLASGDAILAYMVYGITDLKEANGVITAIYHDTDKQQLPCTVTEENGKITAVYFEDGTEISGTTVKTVSDRVSGVTTDLKIGAIMDVTDNKLLNSIKNSTIESLPNDIDKLSINELYAEDIYEEDIYLATEYEEAFLYYTFENDEYTFVGNLTKQQFEDGIYYTYGKTKPNWKLLLYSDGKEQAYSVNNLTALINNITANTQNTSLSELVEAGILTVDDPELLKKPFGSGNVGDMSLITVINVFLNGLPSQNG